MHALYLSSAVAWLLTLIVAGWARGRFIVIFLGILLGVYTLISLTLSNFVGPLLPIYIYLHFAVYAIFILLAYQRMRPLVFRLFVGWPASWFMASTMIAFPWAIAAGLGFHPRFLFIPYVISVLGFVDTFISKPKTVQVALGHRGSEGLMRSPLGSAKDARPLRLIQITDPHLGSFMSVDRLKRICERAVALKPDLIFLTGDFLTVESNHDHSLLKEALAPLKALPERCFACLGNHDHEALENVREGLASASVTLLVDEMVRVETAAGPVEILGFDFHFEDRKATLEAVSARYPRSDLLRIALLHHPGAFYDLPEGTADLTLSGHTHGGQLGLLWLGLPHTILSALTKIPDHGLWSRGKDLLYVHRGTGHYGFPLRLGVPPEESLLEVHR
jgi:predicted MPP superfamily phosphohydrolase